MGHMKLCQERLSRELHKRIYFFWSRALYGVYNHSIQQSHRHLGCTISYNQREQLKKWCTQRYTLII